MSGLFRRLRRARDSAAPEVGAPPFTEGDAHEEPTAALEPVDTPPEDLDALVGLPPTTRRRGRLRRRLRHLRRVREVLMRDLGGFLFEVHRSGADGAADPVVEAKLRRLAAVDDELRALESLLDDRRPLLVREAGIGGACPQCGELFGSEARYCWACGSPVAAGAGHVPELMSAYTTPRLEPPPPPPPAPPPPPSEPTTESWLPDEEHRP